MIEDEEFNTGEEMNCPMCGNPMVNEGSDYWCCYYCGWSEDEIDE